MKDRAVVTVIGRDKVGIVAGVSNVLAQNNVNIEDISQTIMGDLFAMIMLVSFSADSSSIDELQDILTGFGEKIGVRISIQHEDLFRFMHRI